MGAHELVIFNVSGGSGEQNRARGGFQAGGFNAAQRRLKCGAQRNLLCLSSLLIGGGNIAFLARPCPLFTYIYIRNSRCHRVSLRSIS